MKLKIKLEYLTLIILNYNYNHKSHKTELSTPQQTPKKKKLKSSIKLGTHTTKGRESSDEEGRSRRELPTKPPNPTAAAVAGPEGKSEAARLRGRRIVKTRKTKLKFQIRD